MDFIDLYRVSRFVTEGALVDVVAAASGWSRYFVSSGRSIDIATGLLLLAGIIPYIISGKWRSLLRLYAYRWMHMA